MSQQQTVVFCLVSLSKIDFFNHVEMWNLQLWVAIVLGKLSCLGVSFHQVVCWEFLLFTHDLFIHGIFNHGKWLISLQCYLSSNFFVFKRNFTRSPVSQNNTAAAFPGESMCVCVYQNKQTSLLKFPNKYHPGKTNGWNPRNGVFFTAVVLTATS